MTEEEKSPTKRCPFCAEVIQSAAVKCRHCGEFLTGENLQRLEEKSSPAAAMDKDSLLFKARPSAWAIAGAFFRSLFAFAAGVFLIVYPIEQIIEKVLQYVGVDLLELSQEQIMAIVDGCRMVGVGLVIMVALILVTKIITLKSTHYRISADRIEWSRGIFSRRIDNIDMFRVMDLKLNRSMLDCIVGVGTVTVYTKDETDPIFKFKKVHHPKILYDIIKKASLDADRKQGVIHID
jgi:hypothetical protein